MITGPRYKKARRLGAHVFEKTQSEKFLVRLTKKRGSPDGVRSRTDYGNLVLEKQRVRVTYGVNERQFKNYVDKVIAKKGVSPVAYLYELLESRLDNAVLRAGFAKTRSLARQMVAHGHILVNGVKTKVPSCAVRKGDVISPREGSKTSPLFTNFEERFKDVTVPAWLKVDVKKLSATVEGAPKALPGESKLDLSAVIEYYRR